MLYFDMALIGMTDAAKRAGTTSAGILRSLQRAQVPLVKIGARTLAVEESDLEAYLQSRGEMRPGRPRKSASDAAANS